MRASCCVRVLPPSSRPPRTSRQTRAPEADRIDAEMAVEAVVLDGDDRVPQIRGDLVERDVAPLLVHPEPRRPSAE